VNNIFAYNSTGISVALGPTSSGSFNDYFSNGVDIQGAALSVTDMAVNPLFIDVLALNLSLDPNSPLRNAGSPATEYNDTDGSRNDLGMEGGPYARRVKKLN
jgi:hypothetical protein